MGNSDFCLPVWGWHQFVNPERAKAWLAWAGNPNQEAAIGCMQPPASPPTALPRLFHLFFQERTWTKRVAHGSAIRTSSGCRCIHFHVFGLVPAQVNQALFNLGLKNSGRSYIKDEKLTSHHHDSLTMNACQNRNPLLKTDKGRRYSNPVGLRHAFCSCGMQ